MTGVFFMRREIIESLAVGSHVSTYLFFTTKMADELMPAENQEHMYCYW